MRKIEYSNQFRRDLRKVRRRGKDIAKFEAVAQLLIHDKVLPESYRDHHLIGNWVNHRDLHIEPDWLLIYKKTDEVLRFVRTGTHSDLFKK